MKTFGVDRSSYYNKVNKGRRDSRKVLGAFYCETETEKEESVRNLSFKECDRIKICAANGYTLKAKVEGRQVYVEQKSEDGTIKSCRINPMNVQKDTKDPIERIAMEAWEKKGEEKEMYVSEIMPGFLYNIYKGRTANEEGAAGSEQKQGIMENSLLGKIELKSADSDTTCVMTAKYAENSTEADPVILVTAEQDGKQVSYQVHVNDVDTRNATAVEMFALCSYADAAGWSFGKENSFQMLKDFVKNAPGMNINGIDSYAIENLVGGKKDWVKAVEKTMEEHGRKNGGEIQFQEGIKLLGIFYKAGADENLEDGSEAVFSPEKIEGYLGVLRKFRDSQFDRGEMVGCRETAIICNDLLNISDDMTGKSEYAANLAGFGQIYRMEGRTQSGVIGFESIGAGNHTYLMHARYADNSTQENPIILVSIYNPVTDSYEEKQTVAVNKIDPENATQIEMFALCSHAQAQGDVEAGRIYRNLIDYTAGYYEDGYTADTLDDFLTKKRNWIEAVRNGITEEMALKDGNAARWKDLLLDFLKRCAENKFEEVLDEEERSGTEKIESGKENEETEDVVSEDAVKKLFEDRQI